MDDLAIRLKRLRLNSDMTQQQVARKLGLTKSVISAYETGTRQPSYDVLINISKLFQVSTDYLLGLDSPDDLDLSGLTELEKSAIVNLIQALKQRNLS